MLGASKLLVGGTTMRSIAEVQVRNDGCLGKGSDMADKMGKEKGRYLKRMCTSRIKRNW